MDYSALTADSEEPELDHEHLVERVVDKLQLVENLIFDTQRENSVEWHVERVKQLEKALKGLENALRNQSDKPNARHETDAALEELSDAVEMCRAVELRGTRPAGNSENIDDLLRGLKSRRLKRGRSLGAATLSRSVAPKRTLDNIDNFDVDRMLRRLTSRQLRCICEQHGRLADPPVSARDFQSPLSPPWGAGDLQSTLSPPGSGGDFQSPQSPPRSPSDFQLPRMQSPPPNSWLVNPEHVTHGKSRVPGGSRGTVYRGRYRDTNVAIKYIDVGYEGSDVRAFKREVSVMSGIEHPRVAKLLGAWYPEKECFTSLVTPDSQARFPDTEPFVIMEFVDGWNLKQTMSSGLLRSVERRLGILQDVANAMKFMHARTVVHGDLKPSNVLVDRDSMRAKVTDFSLLSKGDSALYQPPDFEDRLMSRAYGRDDQKTDVWSFGVMAWELFSGKRPYEEIANEPPIYIMSEIARGSATLSMMDVGSDCPLRAKDLIALCLGQPEKRPSFDSIVDELDQMGILSAVRGSDVSGLLQRTIDMILLPLVKDARDTVRIKIGYKKIVSRAA